MTGLSRLRVLIVLFVLIAGSIGGVQGIAAQEEPEVQEQQGDVAAEVALGTLPVYASICDSFLPPNDDCSPWEGIPVSAETSDGSYNATCVTATLFETVAGCTIQVPQGTEVTAYISEEQIPAGYELYVESPTWYIPTEGEAGAEAGSGPYFFLVPVEPAPEAFPFPVAASICADAVAPGDDCVPWEGVVVSVTSSDGAFSDSCVTATFIEFAAGCEVGVPFGSTVTASISADQIPAGYELYSFDTTWDIPPGVPGGITGQPVFWLVPVGEHDLTPLPVYASICNDALPPNDDCQPWEGVVIGVETADGTYSDTCETVTFFETVAGCEIPMPRGTTVTAYIPEEQIPDGYELFVEVPTWEMPVDGELESGPYFFLVKSDDGGKPTKTPTPTPTATAPVKKLPSTGSGPEQGDGTMLVLLAGAGALTVLGGVYVYAHRER